MSASTNTVMTMRRYLLFTGLNLEDTHLGWDGFQGDFDTVAQAEDALNELLVHGHDWYQIVDISIKMKIEYGEREKEGWVPTRRLITEEG